MRRHDIRSKAGGFSPNPLLSVFLAALVVAPFLAAWGDTAHRIVARQAVSEMPPPLSTHLGASATLDALLAHVMDPDYRTDEPKSSHFFDIDALTAEPPPYASFPRDRAAAARYAAAFIFEHNRAEAAELLKKAETDLPTQLDEATLDALGQAALAKHGTLPWTIDDHVSRLEVIFRERHLDELPAAVAELCHYVADLHQPLHITQDYDGRSTGQRGVHLAFEVNMIRRHRDYYAAIPDDMLEPYRSIDNVVERVFARIADEAPLPRQILEADAEARRRSGATAEEMIWMKDRNRESREWLDALLDRKDTKGLEPREAHILSHADALHDIIRTKYDDMARRQLAEASSMTASLVYTAWLRAGRPPLEIGEAQPDDTAAISESWIPLLPLAAALLVLLVILGRHRQQFPRPPSDNDMSQ